MRTLVLVILLLSFFSDCEKKESEENDFKKKIVPEVLKAIEEENLNGLLERLGEDVYFDSTGTDSMRVDADSRFNKKDQAVSFIKKEDFFYKFLYDTKFLRDSKFISKKSKCFSEFIRENKENIEAHSNYEVYSHLIRIHLKPIYIEKFGKRYQNTFYLIRFKYNNNRFEIESFSMNFNKFEQAEFEPEGAGAGIIDAIKNDKPEELLKYFDKEVVFNNGINIDPLQRGVIFRKSNANQVEAFINRRGKFYNSLFSTEKARKEKLIPDSTVSHREAFLTGYIFSFSCEYIKEKAHFMQLDIGALTSSYSNIINLKCSESDCNKCKIVGFHLGL